MPLIRQEMPKKTSTYSFGNNSFKIEFTGQFMDARGQVNLVYYAVTSSDTRFVLKNNEDIAVLEEMDMQEAHTCHHGARVVGIYAAADGIDEEAQRAGGGAERG